jgi:opacity protein-like surface antigen
MRRFVATIVALSMILPVFIAGSAGANELRDGASLVSGMVGWTDHQSQQSGDRINGGSWSFDYSRVGRGGHWSAGILMRRFESDEAFVSEGSTEETRVNAKRLVTAVQAAFHFTEARFNPYVSMLVGVHMQTSDVFITNGDDFRQSSQTLATGFSAGANFHVTDGIFVRGEYTFHYFADSDTIKNNHMHGVYGGLGFQFGGL